MIVLVVSTSVMLVCCAGLFLGLKSRVPIVLKAPLLYQIVGVALGTVFALVGFTMPLVVLGPWGIPVGVLGAALGVELALIFVLYHVWIRGWYMNKAERLLERRPKLKDTSLERLIGREKRRR